MFLMNYTPCSYAQNSVSFVTMLIESSMSKSYRANYEFLSSNLANNRQKHIYFVAYYIVLSTYILRVLVLIYGIYSQDYPLWIAGPMLEIFSENFLENN